MRHRLALLLILALCACSRTREVGITITNLAPVKMEFSVAYNTGKDSSEISPGHVIAPGSETTIPLEVYKKTDEVYVYGERFDNEYERNVLRTIEEAVYEEPTDNWLFQAEEGDPTAWIPTARGAVATLEIDQCIGANAPCNVAGIGAYAIIQLEDDTVHVTTSYNAVPWIAEPIFDEDLSTAQRMSVMKSRARAFRSSRETYHGDFMRYWNEFQTQGTPTPIGGLAAILGINLTQKSPKEWLRPGVQMNSIPFPTSIWGDQLPYKQGDIILSLNGHIVFTRYDIATELHRHAFLGPGIEEPVKLLVQSPDGNAHTLSTTYRFNEQWARAIVEPGGAFRQGALDAIGFGYGAEVTEYAKRGLGAVGNLLSWGASKIADEDYNAVYKPKISADRAIFLRKQYMCAGRQLWPDEYSAGEFVGIVAPSPALLMRAPLRGVVGGAAKSRVLGKVVAGALLTGAESALVGYHSASPLLPEESKQLTARNWGKIGAVLGGAIEIGGSFLPRSK